MNTQENNPYGKTDWEEVNELRQEGLEETGHFSEQNTEKLREIERTIVSAIIFSKDGKILMGKKDPDKGGVYKDAWHIPGGGVEEGQDLKQALQEEILTETGIDITDEPLTEIEEIGHGESEKTLENGEKVWCKMEFNRFEIHLDQNADEVELHPEDDSDLVELKWFTREELQEIEHAAGGKEFFQEQGYMD